MRGHGVLNDAQGCTNFTGGDAVRRMSDEETEHIQPGLVAQSRERIDSSIFIHISRLKDMWCDCNFDPDPVADFRSAASLILLNLVPGANALGGSENGIGVQPVMSVKLADRA